MEPLASDLRNPKSELNPKDELARWKVTRKLLGSPFWGRGIIIRVVIKKREYHHQYSSCGWPKSRLKEQITYDNSFQRENILERNPIWNPSLANVVYQAKIYFWWKGLGFQQWIIDNGITFVLRFRQFE